MMSGATTPMENDTTTSWSRMNKTRYFSVTHKSKT
jgi:hypothetical protein